MWERMKKGTGSGERVRKNLKGGYGREWRKVEKKEMQSGSPRDSYDDPKITQFSRFFHSFGGWRVLGWVVRKKHASLYRSEFISHYQDPSFQPSQNYVFKLTMSEKVGL